MADSCICYYFFPLISKNELVGRIPTNDSGIPVVSRTPTSTSTLSQAFTSTLGLPDGYTNKNLQKTTKLVLKLFIWGQEHGQIQVNFALQDRPLKAKNFNLYYKHLYIEYYYFY